MQTDGIDVTGIAQLVVGTALGVAINAASGCTDCATAVQSAIGGGVFNEVAVTRLDALLTKETVILSFNQQSTHCKCVGVVPLQVVIKLRPLLCIVCSPYSCWEGCDGEGQVGRGQGSVCALGRHTHENLPIHR